MGFAALLLPRLARVEQMRLHASSGGRGSANLSSRGACIRQQAAHAPGSGAPSSSAV
jgi:hypothetical protein